MRLFGSWRAPGVSPTRHPLLTVPPGQRRPSLALPLTRLPRATLPTPPARASPIVLRRAMLPPGPSPRHGVRLTALQLRTAQSRQCRALVRPPMLRRRPMSPPTRSQSAVLLPIRLRPPTLLVESAPAFVRPRISRPRRMLPLGLRRTAALALTVPVHRMQLGGYCTWSGLCRIPQAPRITPPLRSSPVAPPPTMLQRRIRRSGMSSSLGPPPTLPLSRTARPGRCDFSAPSRTRPRRLTQRVRPSPTASETSTEVPPPWSPVPDLGLRPRWAFRQQEFLSWWCRGQARRSWRWHPRPMSQSWWVVRTVVHRISANDQAPLSSSGGRGAFLRLVTLR